MLDLYAGEVVRRFTVLLRAQLDLVSGNFLALFAEDIDHVEPRASTQSQQS